ncbi:MAG: bifunctional folylpolyglutamate synthase/dihydrofolate synthase [Endomicrobium sp.]|jgi:dihydrofolate synthase/folylpolyglutamate synthase|nr:bifunctional folylpolyglutamate synthase/dihydrofolate synthase [Endomicrobium sp.]
MNNVFEALEEYKGMVPGLSRIGKFLESVGNPQVELKVIHIAGTNGKGSTAAFISGICRAGGYKTALYTSPHLINITERIKVNDTEISRESFDYLSKKYLATALKYELSYFEYLTSLAFIYFADLKVDIAVIETGLGGRFDATNVIEKPLMCVITSISMEHQEILGNNVKKIAFEKAGIIKKGSYVICGKLPSKAVDIVENKSIPYLYGRDFRSVGSNKNKNKGMECGQEFDYTSAGTKLTNIRIRLLGDHQLINAAVAIFATELLNRKGYFLSEANIRTGLHSAVWLGRFDIRRVVWKGKSFKLIIDGAHNIEGINAFFRTFEQLDFSSQKRIFIFGIMKEKKYKHMIKKVAFFAKKIILLKLDNSRALGYEILKREFSKYIKRNKIFTVNLVEDAFDTIESDEVVAAVGSLYLSGELLRCIG